MENSLIRVEDVTMTYRIATSSANGIKDYLAQLVQHKVHYRSLNALDRVSFSVRKGEVVGIIGSNGSGKTTLLKILSGALQPTSGRVLVDFDKVRLLTMGSGFDTELTGRENVFLNGAIIGYSKSFLEKHYDEIVAFAELQDFMEEKVKNYSSGMQSRLAFSIATAGDAPEILLIDEILAVGDIFFMKKSLDRIKEMIRNGATVLLVSHEMGRIIMHCQRAIWIEKGRLCMEGDPEAVCEMYRRHREK